MLSFDIHPQHFFSKFLKSISSREFEKYVSKIQHKKNILTINIINFQDQHNDPSLPSLVRCVHVSRGMKIVCLRKSTLVSRERNYNRTLALLTPKISVFTPVSSTCK